MIKKTTVKPIITKLGTSKAIKAFFKYINITCSMQFLIVQLSVMAQHFEKEDFVQMVVG